MKNVKYILLLMFVFMLGALGFFFLYRDAMSKRVEGYYQEYTDIIVSSLSTDNLIRQTLVVYDNLDNHDFWQEFLPGGIFIFRNNIPATEDGRQDITALQKKINTINEFYLRQKLPPPLYSIDQEHGRVKRLQQDVTLFPSALATGEACRQEKSYFLAMLKGFYTCLDLKKNGIRWNYAPVADLQVQRENPIISTRSFGSQPLETAETLYAYIQGLQNARCLDTLKHFPGHGDTPHDSHETLPHIEKDWATLEAQDLFPFHYVIEKKKFPPSAIMTTHILFPQQDKLPVTLSSFWLSKVLRNDWGYNGIVITDDMGMKGIQQFNTNLKYPREVEAFIAGSDAMLIFNGVTQERIAGIVSAMQMALEANDISIERLRASVRRTVLARLKIGMLDNYLQERLHDLETLKNNHTADEKTFSQIRMLQTLLKHSAALDKQTQDLSERLPLAEKVNQTLSRYGVRNLSAEQISFDDKTKENLHSFAFFTDLEKSSQIYKTLLENNINVLPLKDFFSHVEDTVREKKSVVVFHTGSENLPNFLLQLQAYNRNWQLILYSVEEPFPYSLYAGKLHAQDIFIDSLSNTPMSVQALFDVYWQKEFPPLPSFMYQNLQTAKNKNSQP